MHTNYTKAIRAFAGCAALLLTQSAQSAGFYISEVGTPGSLGTAGVANPVNTISADSSWTNPAGMTGLKQDEMLAGMQLAVPKIEFDSSVAEAGGSDGGNAGNMAVIPSFFMVKKLNDRVRLGFSLVAPQGGAMSYSDNFVGRYGATKVSLADWRFALPSPTTIACHWVAVFRISTRRLKKALSIDESTDPGARHAAGWQGQVR